MYQPGDYVVGYPDYYESNGKRYKRNEGRITYCDNKWSMIAQKMRSEGFNVGWPKVDVATGKKDPDGDKIYPDYMDYQELQGMVIEVDNQNSERPHWDGLVRVLTGERVLWFWARNIRLVRYAGTKS